MFSLYAKSPLTSPPLLALLGVGHRITRSDRRLKTPLVSSRLPYSSSSLPGYDLGVVSEVVPYGCPALEHVVAYSLLLLGVTCILLVPRFSSNPEQKKKDQKQNGYFLQILRFLGETFQYGNNTNYQEWREGTGPLTSGNLAKLAKVPMPARKGAMGQYEIDVSKPLSS